MNICIEIQLIILEHVPYRYVKSCRQTCRVWNEIINKYIKKQDTLFITIQNYSPFQENNLIPKIISDEKHIDIQSNYEIILIDIYYYRYDIRSNFQCMPKKIIIELKSHKITRLNNLCENPLDYLLLYDSFNIESNDKYFVDINIFFDYIKHAKYVKFKNIESKISFSKLKFIPNIIIDN